MAANGTSNDNNSVEKPTRQKSLSDIWDDHFGAAIGICITLILISFVILGIANSAGITAEEQPLLIIPALIGAIPFFFIGAMIISEHPVTTVLVVIWGIGYFITVDPVWPLDIVLNLLAALGIGHGTSQGFPAPK